MSIKLGLYETIDNRFEEWLGYDNALKLFFITNDIEIFGKGKYKDSFNQTGHASIYKLNELIKAFNALPRTDKEGLKNAYFAFIEEMCKPDKKVAMTQNMEDDEGSRTETYSAVDEYKTVTRRDEIEELSKEDSLVTEERTEQLEELAKNARLSNIEIYVLEFLNSGRIEKHVLLDNFTLNGIIQIANRAAYKLYYLHSITAS
jgi:hypothetical protein